MEIPTNRDYTAFVPSNSRRSSNLIQVVIEDGSLDYSADWDTFSFETELNTRKRILEEDLKGYKNLLNQPYSNNNADIAEIIRDELPTNRELYDTLLLANEDIFEKYTALMEEQKNIKENLETLTVKNNSFKDSNKHLKEEEITSCKTYQQLKLALPKANEMYTQYFDIDISTRIVSDTTYEAYLSFKRKNEVPPVTFVVDRAQRKVIDFQPNDALLPEEKNFITNEFGDLDNLQGILCTLREFILKK